MRRELTDQSRQAIAGEYIPSLPQQSTTNLHIHNHFGGQHSDSIFTNIGKVAVIAAAAYFGAMYMQGFSPAEAFAIAQTRILAGIDHWYPKLATWISVNGDQYAQ